MLGSIFNLHLIDIHFSNISRIDISENQLYSVDLTELLRLGGTMHNISIIPSE